MKHLHSRRISTESVLIVALLLLVAQAFAFTDLGRAVAQDVQQVFVTNTAAEPVPVVSAKATSRVFDSEVPFFAAGDPSINMGLVVVQRFHAIRISFRHTCSSPGACADAVFQLVQEEGGLAPPILDTVTVAANMSVSKSYDVPGTTLSVLMLSGGGPEATSAGRVVVFGHN